MKLLNNLDLTGNQLLNAKLQLLGADPAQSAGQIFYNSSTNLAKVSNGTAMDTLTNLLESVAGSGAISVSAIAGKAQTISVAAATAAVPGTLSAADFSKLAASTNVGTPSTLVLRDASGNFAAGTITAALTGLASNASNLNGQAAAFYQARANHTGTQLAASVSDFDAQVNTHRLDQFTAPTAAIPLNAQKITGLADPTNPQDAATKNYVDALTTGLDVKASVRAASTGAIAGLTYNATGGVSGRGQITTAPNVLDTVNLAVNNRLLLKDMGAQNGIWVVTSLGTGANGVWDRATDFDQDAEVTAGAFTFVEEGAVNADIGLVLTTNNPITVGGASGNALTFAVFSSAGTISAGNGLTKVGNTLSAVGTAGRIAVGAAIDIDAAYVGQASITTLGTIATGVWAGTTIAVASGGTGANSVAGTKTSLGFLTRFAGTLTTSATSYTVTHNLNTLDVIVGVIEIATGAVVWPDPVAATVNTVTLAFATAPAANAYRVIVIG